MSVTPYVLLKCATSLDGCLDDDRPERLILSGPEDFDRVDEVRASCDAILVGAGTVRADDPRLLIRSEERRRRRVMQGRPPGLLKVTLTRSGDLDRDAKFFTAGEGPKVVYCHAGAADALRERLGRRAEVVAVGGDDLAFVLRDLADRGVARLLIEGGGDVATAFLQAGLVDELQLSIAPFFVGDAAAPRFVRPGVFPHDRGARMHLKGVEQLGDVALLTFALRRRG
jgi:5-amino-6-(5-phosphoribosylamino)uracil reductase